MSDSMQLDSAAPAVPVAVAEGAPITAAAPAVPVQVATPEVETPEVAQQTSLFEGEESETAERPEWLPEKFKNPEDLSKSYQELEKKLGAHQGAPDEYQMTLTEGLEDYAISKEEPFAQDFYEVLKNNGVNQKTADEISNLYFTKIKAEEESIANAQEHQFAEDCKAVGDAEVQEIKKSTKWIKGIVSEDTYEMLREVGDKDMRIGLMIHQFRKAYDSKNYTSLPENTAEPTTIEDMKIRAREMQADPRMQTDPIWQKKATDFYKKVYS